MTCGVFDPMHLRPMAAHRAHCWSRGRRPHNKGEREVFVLDFDGEGLAAGVLVNNVDVPPHRAALTPRRRPRTRLAPSPRARSALSFAPARECLRGERGCTSIGFFLTICLPCWRHFLMCTIASGRKKCICLPLLELVYSLCPENNASLPVLTQTK